MNLSSLNLNHFRCFESLQVELARGVTIFHGNNAQGKTSILEAICILLRLQSPRTTTISDCVQFSESAFAVGGMLHSKDEVDLRIQLRQARKKLFVDGESQGRSGDYLRHSALVVWMANDDLALVRGSGTGRRRYLDFMASQLFPTYRPALKAYEKALRSRNFLLKKHASPRWPELDAYTTVLAEQGRIVTQLRREIVEKLSPLASESQHEISGGEEQIQVIYKSASGEGDDLTTTLRSLRDEEFKKRQTVAGPHRDDLNLLLNDMPASKFASEGQQRTLALALKLAQTSLFLEMREQAPLILVDDVFGELDPKRRNALMAAWPSDSQKLITTTHLDWLDDRFDGSRRIEVGRNLKNLE